MADFFGTSQVHDDPDHWNELADCVVATVVRESHQSAFNWFTQPRTGWVTASCALIVMLVSALLGFRQPSAATGRGEWVQALAPTDEVGKAIMQPDRAPEIGTLLLRPGRLMK
jgi:hypothetical protein